MEGHESLISRTGIGAPLRLLGELFAPYLSESTDVTDFRYRLKVHIGKVRPIRASRNSAPSTYIFKDLATTTHGFLRHGALRGALQVGPYRLLNRGDKTYTIEVQGAAKIVSTGRLKSAYVLRVDTETASPPPINSGLTTPSGRRVRFPDSLWVQRSQRGVGWWTPGASPTT